MWIVVIEYSEWRSECRVFDKKHEACKWEHDIVWNYPALAAGVKMYEASRYEGGNEGCSAECGMYGSCM